MQLAQSSKLGNRYILSHRIAVGGMGEVWKADDEILGRAVAIKILAPQFLDSPEFAGRFRTEARHAASLTHPGVASVYDYAEEDGLAYLVMEHVNGEPLSAMLARTPVPPLTTTLSILAQTADALAAAHEAGIIHRDVKPGNILITPTGTTKVTDFGIARAIGALPLTALGQVLGTPQYMSPEQASGQPVGPSSDLYSLGVVGYEALAGRRPFADVTPLALAVAHVNAPPPPLPETVPADVRELIGRAMAKDPEDRPASAAVMAAELRAAQMRLMPPPPPAEAGAPPTAVGLDAAATRPMPAAGVAVGAPNLVIDRDVVTSGRRRRRAIAPLLIGVVLAAIVLTVLARHDEQRTLAPLASSDATLVETTGVTTTSSAPIETTVVVTVATTIVPPTFIDPDAYIGRPFGEVRDELEALGFEVTQQKAKGKGRDGNTVLDVQPSGDVAPNSTITLTVGGEKGRED